MSLRFKLVTERDLMSAKFFTAVLINELEIIDEFYACLRIGEPIAVVPSSAQEGVSVSAALIFNIYVRSFLYGDCFFFIEPFLPKR